MERHIEKFLFLHSRIIDFTGMKCYVKKILLQMDTNLSAVRTKKENRNMKINNLEKFKETVASGKTAMGAVITLSDLTVSECAADCGVDFLWIDAEHGPHTLETIKGHITACRGTDCAPFVRVCSNDPGVLKPVLDLAPAGVIIPMVDTAEEAAKAVSACRYPPLGTRGCGVRRAAQYGKVDIFDYLKQSESDPLIIVQIEQMEAVRNLDEILNVPGVDCICVGPCDLSGSMGILCQTEDEELNRIIDEICVKTKKAGKMLGTASAPLKRWQDRGVDWIAMASDWGCMAQGFRNMMKEREKE